MLTPKSQRLEFRTRDKAGTLVSSSSINWSDQANISKSLTFPGWRVRVQKCMNATTERSGSIVENDFEPYTVVSSDLRTSDGLLSTLTSKGVIAVSGNFFPPEIAGLRARASAEFQAKAAEAMRSFDTGSFLGEIRETVQMLKSPMKSIVSLSNAYMKRARRLAPPYGGRKHLGKQTLQDLNSAYLEFTFGVVPLAHDIDSVLSLVGSIRDRGGWKTVSAKASDQVKSDPLLLTSPANAYNFRNNLYVRGSVSQEHEVRVKGAVAIKGMNNSEAAPALAQGFGLGLDQFIPTVYNLIPYSFIVDYFSNVGTFIEAATNYRANYGWSCTTYRVKTSAAFMHVEYGQPSVVPGHVLTTTYNGSQAYRGISFQRQAGIPPLTLSGLYIDVPSVKQIANIASLIASFALGYHTTHHF